MKAPAATAVRNAKPAAAPSGAMRERVVGAVNDPLEGEADRIAARVLAAPATLAPRGTALALARDARSARSTSEAVPASVDGVLASPGMPLTPALRQDMEQRFGHDFASVRVHADGAAARSARDLNAHAYTAGRDIAFAAGRYAPGTGEGRHLIAHELTHVLQQTRPGAAHAPGTLLQRQPATTGTGTPNAVPAATPDRKWAAAWSDFGVAKVSDTKRVPALIDELLAIADASGYDIDVLDQGIQLVEELEQRQEFAKADRLRETLQRKFFIAFTVGRDLPRGGQLSTKSSSVMGDPGGLVRLGEDAARRGDHERAFGYFGAAHEILSYYALQATEKSKATADVSHRDRRYHQLEGIYDEMREIYGFYAGLEAAARAAGDAKRADTLRDKGVALRADLKANHTPFGDAPAEIAETSQVKTATGRPAFRYHGANQAETDLTELPGHPFSADMLQTGEGQDPQNLDLVQGALMGQADFQAEIAREPEIRKAFRDQPVDLNDSAQRLKAWSIMYGVYQRRGPGALGALMALMGRYLKAYTYHTGYNVRDFGTNYIDSKMPSDLAGRLVRDCGVYALTVAQDVLETVRKGDAKLKLDFTLATLLDHIILIITDDATGDTYLVNNDLITQFSKPKGYAPQFARPPGLPANVDLFLEDPETPPPKPFDRDEEVGKQYAQLRNIPYLVTPVNYTPIGSTKDSGETFKNKAWSIYGKTTDYMAKVPVDIGMLEDFSKSSQTLDTLIDELAPQAGSAAAISAWLDAGWPEINSLLVRFEQVGPQAFNRIKPPAAKPAGSTNGGAFRWTGSNHPLVRVALILLRLQSLGQPLTRAQQQYLNYFEKAFKDLLDKSRADALAGHF
ncbi:eCIS core domain-containing protein [Variovorax sp. PBL-E5]|uniref:eCIS core domain-containing protein n=1 Tax=Variovorax sp. PBL-E5 TaxID=434014 RepID=UPI001319813D|nr:DUF4157 domain-containing protein [Variovorax sp. PBL-E5]VTU35484.1 hypothetical protein E5CHR_04076 [Variovorax sp. PBL-E5]